MNICEDNKTLFENLLVVKPKFEINGVEQTVYAFEKEDLVSLARNRGLVNTFVPSPRIAEGWKYSYTEDDVYYEAEVLFKWHSPDSGAGSNSVSQYVYTAQISVTELDKSTGVTSKRYLCADYANSRVEWVRNARQRWTHIPVIMTSLGPISGDKSVTGQNSAGCSGSRTDITGTNNNKECLMKEKKGVVSMTVNFNELLRKANAFNEGESSISCTESELQALFTEFRAIAQMPEVSKVDAARFEQITTIIFCFEKEEGLDQIEIVSDVAKSIFADVQSDFTAD